MNPFEDMRLFCQVMESGSFTAAAEQLGLSKQFVSRRLIRQVGGIQSTTRTPKIVRITALRPTENGAVLERRKESWIRLNSSGRRRHYINDAALFRRYADHTKTGSAKKDRMNRGVFHRGLHSLWTKIGA